MNMQTSFAHWHACGRATRRTPPFADGAEMHPPPIQLSHAWCWNAPLPVKQSVCMTKQALDIPSDTANIGEDQQYNDINTQLFATVMLTIGFQKSICLFCDWVDCSFLRLGSLVDVFRHCAATINWLVKTMPSTIEISLQSGFDNALRLEQHWRSHGKRLPPPVWPSGLRSVKLHTHLSWSHPPLRPHTKYSVKFSVG